MGAMQGLEQKLMYGCNAAGFDAGVDVVSNSVKFVCTET